MFKNIDRKVLVKAYVLILILFAVSMFFQFMRAEGADGTIFLILSTPAIIIAYPFGFFLEKLQNRIDLPEFLVAIVLDILFYAFIVERVYTFFIRRKKIE